MEGIDRADRYAQRGAQKDIGWLGDASNWESLTH
jgi:hypothetical protein